jgi:hypothetical protein
MLGANNVSIAIEFFTTASRVQAVILLWQLVEQTLIANRLSSK